MNTIFSIMVHTNSQAACVPAVQALGNLSIASENKVRIG